MASSVIKKPLVSSPTNIWWGTSSWTCPDDGFVEVTVTPSNADCYLYISDSGAVGNTEYSHCLTPANSHRASITFPVFKGAVLRTKGSTGLSEVKALYY